MRSETGSVEGCVVMTDTSLVVICDDAVSLKDSSKLLRGAAYLKKTGNKAKSRTTIVITSKTNLNESFLFSEFLFTCVLFLSFIRQIKA